MTSGAITEHPIVKIFLGVHAPDPPTMCMFTRTPSLVPPQSQVPSTWRTWRKLCHHAFCRQWCSHVVIRLIVQTYLEVAVCAANVFSLSRVHSLSPEMLQSGSSCTPTEWAEVHMDIHVQPSRSTWMHSFEIYSKWLVQANKHTLCVQCSHTGAQACPNNTWQKKSCFVNWRAGEKRSYQLYVYTLVLTWSIGVFGLLPNLTIPTPY